MTYAARDRDTDIAETDFILRVSGAPAVIKIETSIGTQTMPEKCLGRF